MAPTTTTMTENAENHSSSASATPVSPTRDQDNLIGSATPPRPRLHSRDKGSPREGFHSQELPSPPVRPRLNSREIPRCYSGMYGTGNDDLRPIELARHQGPWVKQKSSFLAAYIAVVATFQIFFAITWEDKPNTYVTSWTRTNGLHFIVTLIIVHWMKGSIYDEQGEMNAMTLWEQLEATEETEFVKRVLKLVPTVLCYLACEFSGFDPKICSVNVIIWCLSMAAKLPIMSEKRLFGINRTVGIDDFEKLDLDRVHTDDSSAPWPSETNKKEQ